MNFSDLRPISHNPPRGSESATSGWVAHRLGRLLAPPRGRPNPFSRLEFYKVGHGLTWKLRLYTGRDRVDIFRDSPWNTLRYWALLLDEESSVEDVAYTYAVNQ